MVEHRFASEHSATRPREVIAEYPASAAMLAFGLGLGLGLVLGASLFESPKADRGFAERFGRQVMDAMSRVMPDPIRHRMG